MRILFAWALHRPVLFALTAILAMALIAPLLAATAAGQDGSPQPALPALANPPFSQVKDKLAAAALARGIPPEILYAVAYWESGWRQLDSGGHTLVSPDGGIGVMQVTSYGNYDVGRLQTDIDYNINAGADILLGKLAETPRIGDGNKSVYENWFYAVWAYNGWTRNNPYPYEVWSLIASGAGGLWAGVPVSAIPAGALENGIGVPVPTPQPAHALNTPKPAPQPPAPAPPVPAKPQKQRPVNLSENMRVQDPEGQVFIIERGRRRLVPDGPTLASLDRSLGGGPVAASDLILEGYRAGRQVPSVTWPDNHDGVLVKGPAGGGVYVMKGGFRHLIPNFNVNDPDDGDLYYPQDVRTIPAAKLDLLPLGAPITENGEIVASSPAGPFYLARDGSRRLIPDKDTFNDLGLEAEAITLMPPADLALLPEGPPLDSTALEDTYQSAVDRLIYLADKLRASSSRSKKLVS